ncbi:hypothetical protein LL364_001278 [Citrobacter freundii]
MSGDSPAPNRPLVASLHKGPFFYRFPSLNHFSELQVKKTAGETSGKCLHG